MKYAKWGDTQLHCRECGAIIRELSEYTHTKWHNKLEQVDTMEEPKMILRRFDIDPGKYQEDEPKESKDYKKSSQTRVEQALAEGVRMQNAVDQAVKEERERIVKELWDKSWTLKSISLKVMSIEQAIKIVEGEK